MIKIHNDDLLQVIRLANLPVKSLLAAMMLMLLDTAASLLTPLFIGLATAQILGAPKIETLSLNNILGIWAVLILLQSLIRYLNTQRLGKAAAEISAQLRLRTYEHIQALPVSFFHEREHGDILSLLSEDIRRISLFLTTTATEVAPHLITVIGATIIVLSIDPIAGFTALCIIPLILFVIRQTSRTARPLSRALAEQQAAHSSLTEENLRLNQLIKTFTREDLEISRFKNSSEVLLDAELQHLQISNRISPIVQAISGIAIILLIWAGAMRIEANTLQASDFVSLIIYGFILFRPLHGLGATYGALLSAGGAAARLTELLSEQAETNRNTQLPFPAFKNEILFDNVSFSYTKRHTTLNALQIRFIARKTTAVIGENGVGKTTLAHLMLRFITADSGSIFIDGTDIKDIDTSDIRRHIAYVPQHTALVNGSIAENIRYGLPNATDEMVLSAAAAALVIEFSKNLPDGLNTSVGPDGIKLSGGQKQRISLARALLKNTEILILDEPTAMFDPEGETELLKKLSTTFTGKTVILITHRPAMLKLADNVIRLSNNSTKQHKLHRT